MSGTVENSEELSIKKAKSETVLHGISSLIVLGIIFFIPYRMVSLLAGIYLIYSIWLFVFNGSTYISMTLEGNYRRWFQILVSIMVPTLLSLYFIKDVESITIKGSFGHMLSLWFLIPVVLIYSSTFACANQLDKQHPFRGFLIASSVIFIICFMGYSEYDYYTDSDTLIIDKEAAKEAAATARYFGQFLVYVIISYLAMLIEMRKKWRTNKSKESNLSNS